MAQPKNDQEMLVSLATAAGAMGLEKVNTTLYKIKTGGTFNENVKNLSDKDISREDLRRTYAFLLATTEEDSRVAKLKLEGLRIMINVRVLEIMPTWCKTCVSDKPFYPMRGETPKVQCLRCRKSACPSCYGEEARLQASTNRWVYLCGGCKVQVEKEGTGEAALDPKHLDKKYMIKQAKEAKEAEKVVEVAEGVAEATLQEDMFNPTQEETSDVEEEGDDTDLENDGNFAETYNSLQGRDKAKNDKADTPATKNKSKSICPQMKQGRCNHGLTGKRKHLEAETCSFLHPRVCQRVLDHGVWGPRGCKEKSREGHFHPRMCRASMGLQGCPTKDCKLGYHLKRRKEQVVGKTIPGLMGKKNAQVMERGGRRAEAREAKGSWNCDKCPLVAESEDELRDHVSNVHNISCHKCNKKFHYLERLDRHMEQIHADQGQHRRAEAWGRPCPGAGGPGRGEQGSLPAGGPTEMSAFLDILTQTQQQQQQQMQILQQMMREMAARTPGQAVVPAPGQQQVRLPLLSFQ